MTNDAIWMDELNKVTILMNAVPLFLSLYKNVFYTVLSKKKLITATTATHKKNGSFNSHTTQYKHCTMPNISIIRFFFLLLLWVYIYNIYAITIAASVEKRLHKPRILSFHNVQFFKYGPFSIKWHQKFFFYI